MAIAVRHRSSRCNQWNEPRYSKTKRDLPLRIKEVNAFAIKPLRVLYVWAYYPSDEPWLVT